MSDKMAARVAISLILNFLCFDATKAFELEGSLLRYDGEVNIGKLKEFRY